MDLPPLSDSERTRYARHLSIPDVGESGQRSLKQASVLLVGSGGLGSPAALYLAAAGIGRIGIVDDDVVDRSNLQRQILHGESWVGKAKTESAADRLSEINPEIRVETHAKRLTPDNGMEIAENYDMILDGSDNFPTRFLTNDIAFFQRKPCVFGSIFRFEGQVSVFAPHLGGPCYRCMLPTLPPPGAAPSCAEAGVLGVLPGVIGSLQAMEAIKLILDIGTPPIGKLICYDALRSSFRTLNIAPHPGCRLCGGSPSIGSIRSYETTADSSCTMASSDLPSITVDELAGRLPESPVIIDVRQPEEHAEASIPGSILIPLGELPDRLAEIPSADRIYVHCKAGGRSARAVALLHEEGMTNCVNVEGGMDAWLNRG